MSDSNGSIIFLNGPSSSGKSSIARQIVNLSSEPFWHYSIDHIREAGILPMERLNVGDFSWSSLREMVFEGFHNSIPAFARAGNNLIVEHIIETEEWRDRLIAVLAGFDIFIVGADCPLAELERREKARGDRPIGDARYDFATVHKLCKYDLRVDSTLSPSHNGQVILKKWQNRTICYELDRIRP